MSKLDTKLNKELSRIKKYWMEAFSEDGDWRYLISEFEDEGLYEDEDFDYVEIDFGGDDEIIAKYFSRLPKELLADRELVIAVTSTDALCLRFASEELRSDHNVVLNVIESRSMNYEKVLEYVSDTLLDDSKFIELVLNKIFFSNNNEEYEKQKKSVLKEVSKKGDRLDNVPEVFKHDKDVVRAAVSNDGLALAWAPAELRNDFDIVLTAVMQLGWVLQYASNKLRDDKEVVLAAVKQHGGALKHASDRLRGDKEVALAALRNGKYWKQYVSIELLNDPEIIAIIK